MVKDIRFKMDCKEMIISDPRIITVELIIKKTFRGFIHKRYSGWISSFEKRRYFWLH